MICFHLLSQFSSRCCLKSTICHHGLLFISCHAPVVNLLYIESIVTECCTSQFCLLPERDKTRCASFISLSRRSPHTNTSHSAAAHCSRKKKALPLRLILKRSALKVFGTGTYALLYTVICYDVPLFGFLLHKCCKSGVTAKNQPGFVVKSAGFLLCFSPDQYSFAPAGMWLSTIRR